MFRNKFSIHWIDVNVKIVDNRFSSYSWGTDVIHARN